MNDVKKMDLLQVEGGQQCQSLADHLENPAGAELPDVFPQTYAASGISPAVNVEDVRVETRNNPPIN